MDQLESAVNEVSDKDWAWWPFLWLRPVKHEPLSFLRIAVISVLYGLPASVLTQVGIKVQYAASHTEIVATSLLFPLLFLFFGTVFIAPMWNRRASALRSRRNAGFSG